jgi:hypothetical protein
LDHNNERTSGVVSISAAVRLIRTRKEAINPARSPL